MIQNDLTQAAQQLVSQLQLSGRILTVAESCTGGWLAKLITDIAGSSSVFERGYVTYSNAAKQDMLSVNQQTLQDYGAVSAQTVTEMVAGALAASQADLAIAVSGIAGPSGGSHDKPVGTVWIGWGSGEKSQVERFLFKGDRNEVRKQACHSAMSGLLRHCVD